MTLVQDHFTWNVKHFRNKAKEHKGLYEIKNHPTSQNPAELVVVRVYDLLCGDARHPADDGAHAQGRDEQTARDLQAWRKIQDDTNISVVKRSKASLHKIFPDTDWLRMDGHFKVYYVSAIHW